MSGLRPGSVRAGGTHLHHQVVAALAEALQHAQEEVRGLHQVPEERLRLLGLVVLAEECEEDLPVLHHVEDVTLRRWRYERYETTTATAG